MDREQRERLVDQALARALAPKKIEPRDGLEDRLLANLAAQPERRPWWARMRVPAVAAAVVLAIVVGVKIKRQSAPMIEAHRTTTVAPKQPDVIAKAPAQTPQVTRHKLARRASPRVLLAHETPANLPKQDVFPTPVPVTEQESLLLALVQRRPQQVQKIAAEQEAQRMRTQKLFDTGDAPDEPAAAQQMR